MASTEQHFYHAASPGILVVALATTASAGCSVDTSPSGNGKRLDAIVAADENFDTDLLDFYSDFYAIHFAIVAFAPEVVDTLLAPNQKAQALFRGLNPQDEGDDQACAELSAKLTRHYANRNGAGAFPSRDELVVLYLDEVSDKDGYKPQLLGAAHFDVLTAGSEARPTLRIKTVCMVEPDLEWYRSRMFFSQLGDRMQQGHLGVRYVEDENPAAALLRHDSSRRHVSATAFGS